MIFNLLLLIMRYGMAIIQYTWGFAVTFPRGKEYIVQSYWFNSYVWHACLNAIVFNLPKIEAWESIYI